VTPQELTALVRKIAVLPIIVPRSVDTCLETIGALAEGGATGVEIVLRTAAALPTLEASARAFPSMVFAAGTVLSTVQYDEAAAAGAHFAISPGLSAELADHAAGKSLPLVPGVQTATEVMAALGKGFTLLKFYPSEPAGGTVVLGDFGNVFPAVSFMPSGKINADLLPGYAALRNVASVGGTWMLAEQGKAFERTEIVHRMRRALDLVRVVKD